MMEPAGLRALLREGVEQGHFAGACALVTEHGRVVAEAAAGDARVEPTAERAAATNETLWDLASLTKPLAGTALVLALADEGLLSLDDEIGRFDDLFRKEKFRGVTLRRLLTHTGGLVAWTPLYVRGEGRTAYRHALAGLDPEAPPGTRVVYSCPGFLVLSNIVESVAQAPLDELFAERVADPLGLTGELLYAPAGGAASRAAGGERDDATEREKTAGMGISWAGFRYGVVNGEVNDGNALRRGNGVALNAGLFGTARAVAALARAWLVRDRRLLREATAAEAVRNQTPGANEDRGLGWGLARTTKSAGAALPPDAFGHTGFTGSSVFVDPHAGRVSVLLANRLHPDARSADGMIAFRRRFHDLSAALD
jgi:CubicO group peptidase (beta-lactamase class C family)